jgi:hypothetical protein
MKRVIREGQYQPPFNQGVGLLGEVAKHYSALTNGTRSLSVMERALVQSMVRVFLESLGGKLEGGEMVLRVQVEESTAEPTPEAKQEPAPTNVPEAKQESKGKK